MADLALWEGGGKAQKEEVFEYLSDGQWHTTGEMARYFDVSNPTIGNRVKALVGDGFSILAGRKGYRLREVGDIATVNDAREVEHMMQRMFAIVMRQAMVAKPMKKLASQARKLLPKSKEERAIIRAYLMRLTHLIDFQDIEDDF